MKLKQIPEDFLVTEKINLQLEEGDYLVYKLRKRDTTTFQAVDLVAQRLRLRHRFVGFAGNKDKRAITEQYITIPKDKKIDFETENITFELIGERKEPLSLGDLDGNDFVITARSLKNPIILENRLMPNYFDDQRFGANNAKIGKLLVKRDFKLALELIITSSKVKDRMIKSIERTIEKYGNDYVGALRRVPLKLLKFYIHAYQSYLFNLTLSKFVQKVECFEHEYSLGKLHFPKSLMENKVLPVIGFSTPLYQKDYKDYMGEILEYEQIIPRDFIIKEFPELSSEGATREAFVPIQNLEIGNLEDDELNDGFKKIKFKFFLQKSSYATIAIKSILQEVN